MPRRLLFLVYCYLLGPWSGISASAYAVDFNLDVQPVLAENCYPCHGPDTATRQADLRLDVREQLFRTQDGISIVVPGDPTASELVRRVTTSDTGEVMPPVDSNRKLTPAQIDVLRRWVEGGAGWAEHWAFRAPARPEPPSVHDIARPRNAIDRFVLARLQREGLAPSPAAAPEVLLRRVTFDLTGLPPTPSEVDAFLDDDSPSAYAKVVDRLLASPRYGERMVWEWLEASRYADSNGYQGDSDRTMWPWRDWAVSALNGDMPFDRFTVEQLAGDLLPSARFDQRIATGFNRNHMINGEGGRIPEENRVEYVFDQIETMSAVWLGLTVGCARCHDHKFDPLSQEEYYQLFAFFNSTPVDGAGRSGSQSPFLEVKTRSQEAQLLELESRFGAEVDKVAALERGLFPRDEGETAAKAPRAKNLPEEIRTRLDAAPSARRTSDLEALANYFAAAEQADYAARLHALKVARDGRDQYRRQIPRVMVMEELANPRSTFILTRGVYNRPGKEVQRAVPAILPRLPQGAPLDRLGLAQWLVDPSHPLTARVIVNRYWQMFFGAGLVRTVDDFGVQGEEPSHPELLDWLATEFVRSGWNVKRLHRLIVTSSTYRQSSKQTAEHQARDPINRLLARGPRFRLPSYMIRDQALALSGLLVRKLGGRPVKPYQPAGVWEEATFGKKSYEQDHGESLYRRSLYTFWRRIVGPTMFFDAATRQTCTVRAQRTNTPLHALITLNDPTYVEAARAMAERLMAQGHQSAEERIAAAFRLATGRWPSTMAQKVLKRRLDLLTAEYEKNQGEAVKLLSVGESPRNENLDSAEHAALTMLCSLLLNLDEVITKE